MQPEIEHRERRRYPDDLTDTDAYEHGDDRDRRPLIAHQTEHQPRDRYAKPDVRLNQPNPECGEGQAETKLEARCDAARQGSGKAADDARDAENPEHRTDHQTGTGYCRRVIGSINIAADAAFIGCTAMGTP